MRSVQSWPESPAAGSVWISNKWWVFPPRAAEGRHSCAWGEAADVNAAIAELRTSGETVVHACLGHESEVDEFRCDRELVQVAGRWVVQTV